MLISLLQYKFINSLPVIETNVTILVWFDLKHLFRSAGCEDNATVRT